ncbi:hypothetical protein H4S06_004653 [Coemansia sp. BCRC 34490]|nr:hypothetical protein H4217_009107 [Coemansia sp. RSA 1939]KAJ2509923.1 hypothetical protein GGI11_005692 [Coemansia sp. RSA 2049]KAJ2588859.1 hypothetical protein EV177_009344 [Coemansia sp. RSA 1804]KAJ2681640.1 hypothetical protein GGH99_005101 [Coemansia sp. RSA 1285]KAJ2749370.1 hypothetical protein H4S06_004653 [Coemansia sp. BCRC 34490]
MRFFQSALLFAAAGQLLAVLCAATEYARPATKDSTIMRSTVSCPDCPERNCYKCTLGGDSKLTVNTGGLAYNQALIGFTLPVDASEVTQCTVQIPAFVNPLQYEQNITVYIAASSDWDESTVSGETAPQVGDQIAMVTIPAYNNAPPIAITQACQAADANREFSIYFGSQFGYYQFWSKDSGNPAIIHVYTS